MRAHAHTVAADSASWTKEVDDKVEEVTDGLTESFEEASAYLLKLIKKQPLLCLAGSVALGYLLGRLVRQ